jgi:hypothetical protein
MAQETKAFWTSLVQVRVKLNSDMGATADAGTHRWA